MTEYTEPTADEFAAAQAAHAEMTERATAIVDQAVEQFVNEAGHTEVTALDAIAKQVLYKALLFANLLEPQTREALSDMPLIHVVPAPESLAA